MRKKITTLVIFIAILASRIEANPLPIYPAEIIGRDLLIPGLGWVGHVGITTAPFVDEEAYQVLEVLNENRVVQLNTIAHFKMRSAYWGSRYGIVNNYASALQILREANVQRCLGAEYTYTSVWYPAVGYISSYPSCNTIRFGKFRSDTFVDYVFTFAGYYLPIGNFISPSRVFDVFPFGNGDGPYASPYLSKPLTIELSHSLDTVTAQELEDMSFEEFMGFVDNPINKITIQTVKNVWDLALNSSLSIDKRNFLMDYLGGISGVDMIPKLIEQYPKIEQAELKSMILRDIQDIYQKYDHLDKNPYEKNLLQKFYLELLNQELSPRDAQMVIWGFMNMNSKGTMLANINKINVLLNSIDPYIRIGLQTNFSMKIKELETAMISDILNTLNNQNDPQLDERFFLYVVDSLSRGIDRLSPELKNRISTYLGSVKYQYDNHQALNSQKGSLLSPGAWLEASALINSSSLEEAGKYLAKFIESKHTIREQETYIIGLSSREYLKKAFKNEPVLINFKKKREAIYLDTVGAS